MMTASAPGVIAVRRRLPLLRSSASARSAPLLPGYVVAARPSPFCARSAAASANNSEYRPAADVAVVDGAKMSAHGWHLCAAAVGDEVRRAGAGGKRGGDEAGQDAVGPRLSLHDAAEGGGQAGADQRGELVGRRLQVGDGRGGAAERSRVG
ncbi:hypothetical protein ZWY2020_032519 [Hordeum vulgare]|nr:hypothetical protein ZWY2020_032519 [Hordeum vulgare]